MKLRSFNYLASLLIIFLSSPVFSEEKIDIWKNKKEVSETQKPDKQDIQKKPNLESNQTIQAAETIQIQNSLTINPDEKKVYGIYEPANYDLGLNMWSTTKAEDLRSSLKRLKKINLSKSSNEILEAILFSFSYPPNEMTEKEFVNLKIDWLIQNDRLDLIERFLKQNDQFDSKSKVIQYLVDKNIAKANLSEGCKKSEFIGKEIKDSYLEKFKIYCLIFNNKKNEAQLIFDILKEQKLSDKFFDNKINFLLGINAQPNKKVKDDNLLNFYLSSITVPNFNYEPNNKTNKFIWEYLNAANLVQIQDLDKERIKTLEMAANNDSMNKSKIFEIYKKIPFDLISLINAEGTYQSLDGIDSRALIFQKYLLSDNIENKIKLLVLLKDLFKKDNLSNIFTEFMSERLKELNKEDIPESYMQVVNSNIILEEVQKLGKIKFNDKILHRSKVMKYYTETNISIKKSQKDFNNVYKKIKRNKNYFFSAKDLALIESLESDGFLIPKEIKHKEIAKEHSIPDGLLKLINNKETGLLSLKLVEIIGEDEIHDLDPETIYFMVNILNRAKLIKFRNKVLTTALPLRS